jgi:CheY-like chemotaxis protein
MAGKPLILIVDDDAADREALEQALLPLGARLSTIADGHQLRDAVASLRPDLIVLDALLPGISGFDLCREIKGSPTGRQAEVVIVTGVYVKAQYRADAMNQFRADGFITKPFRVSELQRLVLRLLGKKYQASSGEVRLELRKDDESSIFETHPRWSLLGAIARLFRAKKRAPEPAETTPPEVEAEQAAEAVEPTEAEVLFPADVSEVLSGLEAGDSEAASVVGSSRWSLEPEGAAPEPGADEPSALSLDEPKVAPPEPLEPPGIAEPMPPPESLEARAPAEPMPLREPPVGIPVAESPQSESTEATAAAGGLGSEEPLPTSGDSTPSAASADGAEPEEARAPTGFEPAAGPEPVAPPGPSGNGSSVAAIPLSVGSVGGLPIYPEDVFFRELRREMSRCRRSGKPLTLMLIRVDDLGQIVELFGQEARQRVLRHVAELAVETAREVDMAGLVLTEELVGLAAFAADRYGGGRIAARIARALTRRPFSIADGIPGIVPVLRFGMATFPVETEEADGLVVRAREELSAQEG